jgi:fructokinase
MHMIRIGIDLGGTKIEGIALSSSGETLWRKRIPTPQGDYTATLKTIQQLVADIETELKLTGSVGICTPGALSPATGLLRNSNSVCLNDMPVIDDLQQLLQRDIRMANDANCFALSEATDGAASVKHTVFGVIIGTGTGAGIVINRHLLTGQHGIAGEWGHNPLPWPTDAERPGRACYCGKHGCIETWVSGPGMTQDHEMISSEVVSPQQIVEHAQSGDVLAEQTLQRYEQRLARSLAHVINILDPDIIVLGGGMGNIERLYSNVPALWGDYVFSDVVMTQLVPPQHGDSSGVRGAAWLWNN